jgi:FixJ family two-component response regulator
VAGACCLLLDVHLPDLNGLELQQRVSDRPDMPVIFITGDTDVQTIVSAMKAGALEYFTKPFGDEVLLRAISFALDRSQAMQSRQAAARRVQDSYASLSVREREVMELVASGWLNKQIAAALGLSEITVKVHRSKMMHKMKAASLPDLVMMARTLDLKSVPMPSGSFFRSFERYAGTRNHLAQAHASTG